MLSIEVINCDWIKPSPLTPCKQPGFEPTTATPHKLNHHRWHPVQAMLWSEKYYKETEVSQL